MKKVIFTCFYLAFSLVWAQVGVFNDDPKGDLDVNTYSDDNIGDVASFVDSEGEIVKGIVLPTIQGSDGAATFNNNAVINPRSGSATNIMGTLIYDEECDGLRYYIDTTGWTDCITAP